MGNIKIYLYDDDGKIFLKKEDKIGHGKIDKLVETHKEMLSNLNALKNEFKNIKNSERYRIENNLKVAKLEPKKSEIQGKNRCKTILKAFLKEIPYIGPGLCAIIVGEE